MKYICKEGFAVGKYDDDGLPTDTYMNIEVGEVYEVDDDWRRLVGGYGSVHLKNNENGNWLELQQETIDRYFDQSKEEGEE